jgi:hypothetical protein
MASGLLHGSCVGRCATALRRVARGVTTADRQQPAAAAGTAKPAAPDRSAGNLRGAVDDAGYQPAGRKRPARRS